MWMVESHFISIHSLMVKCRVCIYISLSQFSCHSRLLRATAYGCDVALAAQQPSQEVLLLCIDVLRKPTATRPHRQHSTAGHS